MYQSLAQLQQNKELNLYVSPMMLDEQLKESLPQDFSIKNVKGFTSWHLSIDHDNNILFKKQVNEFSGRKPDLFSLLGWETGILLQQIETLLTEGVKGFSLIDHLKKMKFDSPRGWLKIDGQTQQTYSPAYLVSVSGNFEMKTEACLEDNDEERKNFNTEKPEGAASGWRNTYLCS
jgi:branched-chain amino acid transport system substrate-binding protein